MLHHSLRCDKKSSPRALLLRRRTPRLASPSSTSLFARLTDLAGALVRPLSTPTEPLGFELAGDLFVVDDDPQPLISLLILRPTARVPFRVLSATDKRDPLSAEPRAVERHWAGPFLFPREPIDSNLVFPF